MQRLYGRLARLLPTDWELWLDGGHNPGAGMVLAEHLNGWADRPIHLVIGMKQAKDSAEFLRPMLPLAETVWAVREPDQHAALPVEAIIAASNGIARAGPRVTDALRDMPRGNGPARVLICGSLYLAGEILKLELARSQLAVAIGFLMTVAMTGSHPNPLCRVTPPDNAASCLPALDAKPSGSS